MVFEVKDMNKTYYAYDLENPRRLSSPIKITKTGRVWTRIDGSLLCYIKKEIG